jgi:hypothetical protein
LEQHYSVLRDALRRIGLRSKLRSLLRELRHEGEDDDSLGPESVREDMLALVLWLLEGDSHKDALFPFGLPHLSFVRRCNCIEEQAELWVPSPRTRAETRALRLLRSLLKPLARDRDILMATERLDEGRQAFHELRDILRLTGAELPGGDPRSEAPSLPSIRSAHQNSP